MAFSELFSGREKAQVELEQKKARADLAVAALQGGMPIREIEDALGIDEYNLSRVPRFKRRFTSRSQELKHQEEVDRRLAIRLGEIAPPKTIFQRSLGLVKNFIKS